MSSAQKKLRERQFYNNYTKFFTTISKFMSCECINFPLPADHLFDIFKINTSQKILIGKKLKNTVKL
jgi:hypothetical protein